MTQQTSDVRQEAVASPFKGMKDAMNAENGQSKPSKHRSALSFSMSFDSLTSASTTGSARLGVPKRSSETAAALEEYIRSLGGDRPVHSVLVANNGLAAVKFIRSIRSWAYKTFGDERAVNLIAMASPEDMKADAEHIRLADQFVEVPGGRNVNNYANVQLIVSIAMRTGVDAVWPGWGHASEVPSLPQTLSSTPTDIRFIGPPAHAMEALGDKIGSTILAQSAGVPTLPWSGDGVTIDYTQCADGIIPADIYDRACIHSLSEALACCQRIGYPVMLKASQGGGGKGIRKVMNDDDVRLVFRQVQGEVPGSPIFAMKLAPQSRHLEVQLLCDAYGNVCSLFSRDCSVQRRHQKIVEEGPVTAAPLAVRNYMERCARALARSVGYVGAATVEFLYALESGEYCFLELNPRLQVEHPVTEWISGVNIPAAQLLIAQGVPLHAIPDIRRLWGKHDGDMTSPSSCMQQPPIDFENSEARGPPAGHVVAVRITAENANAGFKPTSGKVEEIAFRSTPEVWGYFSVKGGGAIHEFSDSQFGHLFAKGENREAAIRAMVVALKEIRVRGEIRSNTDYVCELLQTDEFRGDYHHTGWLDARIAAQITAGRPPWHLSVVCGAVLRALEHTNGRLAEYLGYLEKGQLPPARISLVSTTEEFVLDGKKYAVKVVRTGPQTLSLSLCRDKYSVSKQNTTKVDVVARKLNDGGLLIQVDGQSHVVHAEEEPVGTRLSIGTQTCLLSNEHDPSAMTALSTGKLVRYLVDDGAHVLADAPYAEMEVMKMVMTLLAPAAGHVHFMLPEGSVLAPGQLIARLELDDPESVCRAEPFDGSFPELGPPVLVADGVGQRFQAALEAAKNVCGGYHNDAESVVNSLLAAMDDPALFFVLWQDVYGVAASRIPPPLALALESAADNGAWMLEEASRGKQETQTAHPGEWAGHQSQAARGSGSSGIQSGTISGSKAHEAASICASQLLNLIDAALDGSAPFEESISRDERAGLDAVLEPLRQVAASHADGKEAFARTVVSDLLETFLRVEEQFEGGGKATEQEIIDTLRRSHLSSLQSLQSVVDLVISHNGLRLKSGLVVRLMAALVLPAPDPYRPLLRRLAALGEPGASEVAAWAMQLLERSLLGELRSVVARALSDLDMFTESSARPFGDIVSKVFPKEGEALRKNDAVGLNMSLAKRRHTYVEGLYAGLDALDPFSSVEARMTMLVEAPAAVEDALASCLLDHSNDVVRQRALTTYIRRIYFPFLLHEPFLLPATKQLKNGTKTFVWAYERPDEAGTPLAKERLGAAILIPSLKCISEALDQVHHASKEIGLLGGGGGGGLAPGTLHVVLTGQGVASLALSESDSMNLNVHTNADARLDEFARQQILQQSDCEDAMLNGNEQGKGVDPVALARAVMAELRCVASSVKDAGFEYVSVLCKRGVGGAGRGDGAQQQLMITPLRVVVQWDQATGEFVLDPVLGTVEPPIAATLELGRIAGLRLAGHGAGAGVTLHKDPVLCSSSRNRQWLMFRATERFTGSTSSPSLALRRVFLRGTVRQLGRPDLLAATYSGNAPEAATAAMEEVEITVLGALEELERVGNTSSSTFASASSQFSASGPHAPSRADWSHIYLDVLSPLPALRGNTTEMEQSRVAAALKAGAASTASKCGAQLRKAGVAQWEVKLRVGNHKGGDGDVASNGTERSPRRWRGAWRVVVSVPTGHEAGDDCVEVYREACDEEKGLIIYSANADGGTAMLSDIPTSAPYPPLEWLQYKRLIARRHNTTYCRDFPAVFENALRQMWAARAAGGEPGAVPPAGRLVELAELVPETATLSFRNPPKLTLHRGEENRKTVGVVAWVMTLRTPEYPQGRQIVAVANDITHASGAFGPAEDAMFRAATEYSLRERLPLVYLAANSGARVGLANEVKSCLRAAWTSSDDPSRGFDYLYLTPQDYEKLCAKANEDLPVRATKVIVRGDGGQMEERWRLTDVIGLEDGLGVECLSGSGAIAGVYARAFREGFTITLVSGRTVGIGAYLARLGRRCVQRLDQPIILTGYAALNKLLGREVYTSHMQLGGPKVMGANGVSHFVVEDDLAGVAAVLRWLSYTAARPGDPPPRLLTADPEDRPVLLDDLVSSSKLDPRVAIAGNDRFPGLFDRGSWTESQAGWARTVVTGRARLGGQAVGVVAVEVSTVMLHLPADPGLPDSSERSVPQAGQVWFPDSALKTAQAMEEFDLEGLPLFVLANWRGFSGGQRDLFEGVLQAGSLIVESLRTYRQPVIVYIPPGCELRGGAWVVIDSQINSAGLVESYADPGARGGVLEPEGVVEIKFRMPELRATMHRLDPVLREAIENAPPGTDVKNTPEFRAREAALLPVYHQIALAFAEMHDTPVRMVSKGVLRGIVPWERARAFFSHRLRSLLAREALLRHIAAADPAIKREEGLAKVHEWFEDSKKLTSVNEVREEHEAFLEWMESSTGTARLAMELKSLRHQAACRTVLQLAATAEGTDGLVKGLAEAVKDNPSLVLQLRSLVGTAMKEV